MAKTRTAFFCQNCGAESPKWVGRCGACDEWNTYVEEVVEKGATEAKPWSQSTNGSEKAGMKPILLSEIEAADLARLSTGDTELDRVLGGGVVPGSLVLVGGEPGIGKSTLLLQLALSLKAARVLYVSGEESGRQVRMRADRIGQASPQLYLLTETALAKVFRQVRKLEPDLLIIDSIQTLQTDLIDSPPGSVSQIKACAGDLQRFAKESGTPVMVIGHINKEGAIAGPKVLEHMVDTVLQFEGDRNHTYRILRTVKNRFGSTSELGIYEMRGEGLRPVENPSEVLLGQRDEPVSGIAIAATVEGLRPMLIETQALVSPAVYSSPQRTATGFDLRRLSMLLAVLEKRCGFPFGTKDVFLNIAGGIRVEDPAIDLAVISALLSSFEDTALPLDVCFCGEVGLSGEVRAVGRFEQRMSESARLGYKRLLASSHNVKGMGAANPGIEVIGVSQVEEVYRRLIG